MTFAERNRAFILKLQALPENKKKIILWAIVVVLATVMGFFWITGAINSFSKIAESAKSVKLPTIDLPKMPSLNLDILKTVTPSDANIITK